MPKQSKQDIAIAIARKRSQEKKFLHNSSTEKKMADGRNLHWKHAFVKPIHLSGISSHSSKGSMPGIQSVSGGPVEFKQGKGEYASGGFFESTGYKMAHEPPRTMRGFEPETRHFDIHTDKNGDIRETRKHDSSEAEPRESESTHYLHTGKDEIKQHAIEFDDWETRNPHLNHKKEYGSAAQKTAENKKEHEDRKEIFLDHSKKCRHCGGSGKAFNFSNTNKHSTGDHRSGYGTCAVCHGSGKR